MVAPCFDHLVQRWKENEESIMVSQCRACCPQGSGMRLNYLVASVVLLINTFSFVHVDVVG